MGLEGVQIVRLILVGVSSLEGEVAKGGCEFGGRGSWGLSRDI